MRKAQISHVFTYIIIILVVGLIVIFGYKSWVSIINVNCDKQRVGFEKGFIGFVEEYSDKGSVHEEVIEAPCDVSKVCIASSRFCDSSNPLSQLIEQVTTDSVIRASVNDCVSNIFLMGEFTEIPKYLDDADKFSKKIALKDEDASPSIPFECFEARNGKFKFLFRGLGRKTQIESGW